MNNVIVKTSDVWIKEDNYKHLTIMDPDGWDRQNFNFSFFNEEISEEEFNKRLMVSSLSGFRKVENG